MSISILSLKIVYQSRTFNFPYHRGETLIVQVEAIGFKAAAWHSGKTFMIFISRKCKKKWSKKYFVINSAETPKLVDTCVPEVS